jgi:hypothetical protein
VAPSQESSSSRQILSNKVIAKDDVVLLENQKEQEVLINKNKVYLREDSQSKAPLLLIKQK